MCPVKYLVIRLEGMGSWEYNHCIDMLGRHIWLIIYCFIDDNNACVLRG